MQEYRLYLLAETGELHMPYEFQAANDDAAIAIAEQRCLVGRQMELWTGKTKVHCWGLSDCPSDCGTFPTRH